MGICPFDSFGKISGRIFGIKQFQTQNGRMVFKSCVKRLTTLNLNSCKRCELDYQSQIFVVETNVKFHVSRRNNGLQDLFYLTITKADLTSISTVFDICKIIEILQLAEEKVKRQNISSLQTNGYRYDTTRLHKYFQINRQFIIPICKQNIILSYAQCKILENCQKCKITSPR